MDNSTKKIQAQHNLFNKVLDFYNFSRTRQDLAVIDPLTFRKDIMNILDKVEDDECLLKSMEALIEYIRDADKISEEVDDLAVALFNSLNMKDIPQTYNYLHDIFKAELSIFCKSKTIFHICFYYITGMSNTNKSVAENFSFIEHTDFLEKIVKHGFEKDDLISQSKIFLSKIDFSFFSEPHIFTIFEDNRYRSLFNSYIKTYNFLKREKTLSDVNQDIHEEFVANFIEYYIYYDVSFFDHSRQGHIINDIPAEQAADILNNIDLFRYIDLDDKGGVEASNDISSLTGIEKYLDSKTFKAISERASRFSDILSFLKDKPAIIEKIILNKLKNDYIFSTLIILSKWENAFWFIPFIFHESPITFIEYASHNHKKIKNYQLKKFAFKILDFINNEDWNNRLYYLTHKYHALREEYFDIDELISDYYLAPDDFFIDNYISSEFAKTYRPTFSIVARDKKETDEENKTNDSNEIHHIYKNTPPINICFFTNEKRNEQVLKNNEREAYPDMAIEKEEYNDIDSAFKSVSKMILEDLNKVQSYPSKNKSDYDFGEPEPEIDFNDDTNIPSFLPENDTKTVFFKEKGSDHIKEISYADFLLKKQDQKKNTEMKIAPDTEGVALNHNTSSFTIYDASAEAELEQYIEDLGDESKGVVALYKKIKRLGNSRNLYNNDLLFKNIDSLRESFPNFSSFIDHIEGHAILNKRGDNHFSIPPSLLVGDPGIGKTFFLAEMAELFGIKREIIHMETISASWLLTGASAQWKDAKTGLIFNKTINSTHANNIVILDELDKALNTSNYPPANSLLQLFEQHTAKEFKDEYFPLRIDVSKMIWLATANDLSTISEPLLSRLDTFRIINPNFDERKQLANRIYSSILKSNAWGSSFDSNLADTVLDKLCQPSDSIREMKKTLMNAIKHCAKRDSSMIILEDVSFDTNQSKTKIGFR